MNILITGFMPFGGHHQNVTKIVLDTFEFKQKDITLNKVILPTTFYTIESKLKQAINLYQPDLLIHLGEHGKADAILLERVAINFDDARIPDNNGDQPIDKVIIEDASPAYFSHLPLRLIESRLKDAKIPVKISYSAGSFVCNHLFYLSEHLQSINKNRIRSGFIHLPLIKAQDERSNFSLETLKDALRIIVESCIKDALFI